MARPKKQIHKRRSDGTFEAKVTIGYNIDGKPIRKSFYSSKSQEDAKLKGERYKIEQEIALRNGDINELNITFRDVAERVKDIKEQKLRANTFEIQYKNILYKHILPFFGDFKIRSIRRSDIERYFLTKKHMSVSTLKTHRGVIKDVFTYAFDNSYIRVNPAKNFKIEVGHEEKVKEVLNKEQMDMLINYCLDNPSYLTVGIYLMASYGLSRSEALGIMRSDIDTVNKTIHIQRSVVKADGEVIVVNTKNKYRNRVIAVSDETIKLIVEDEQYLEKDFIVSPFGSAWSPAQFTWYFDELVRKLRESGWDIPKVTPHGLRHSRASLWIAEDRNLFAIAEMLGWSDLEMLRQRYGHADVEAIRQQLGI